MTRAAILPVNFKRVGLPWSHARIRISVSRTGANTDAKLRPCPLGRCRDAEDGP